MTCLQTLQHNEILHRPENSLSFVSIVTGIKGSVRLFAGSSILHEYHMDISNGQPGGISKSTTSHSQPIRSVSYNPICKMIISLCEDSLTHVWAWFILLLFFVSFISGY